MGLQRFGTLCLEIVAFEHVCVAFLLHGGVELRELRRDEATECSNGGLRDLDAPVVVLDCGFNIRHIHCFAFTVGAFGVTTGTDEVRVDDATAALGVGHHESGAALTAEHGAFEVVIVGLGFLTGYLLRAEHCSDSVPDFGADEWFVDAVVGGTPKRHAALVVRVGEHFLHR
ncbi:hypothetical protein SD72_05670 [Leucobacter komagatae]|uniref:Uncharacterized protein n=1 Tax=Leucobacter komagatae TaxID=55969 RepID=A0A0D0H763_9MICO|nr:hypothetical protein SD72_05670 [Leucobacter komagatae]